MAEIINIKAHRELHQGPKAERHCGYWGYAPVEPPTPYVVPRHLPGPIDTQATHTSQTETELPSNVIQLDAFRRRLARRAA
jgi:hypothetical protein